MLAVRELCPVYRTVCDDIGRLFSELTELVRRIERDGIHRDYSDDELLEAALTEDPKERIQSIDEFWSRLQAIDPLPEDLERTHY